MATPTNASPTISGPKPSHPPPCANLSPPTRIRTNEFNAVVSIKTTSTGWALAPTVMKEETQSLA